MTKSEFALLASKPFLLDGATGTELAKKGMPSGVAPELWIYENPSSIIEVHNAYIAAGSRIVYAPTFGGNRCKLDEFGLACRQEEIVGSLMRLSKENAAKQGAYVFGDIAPTGRFVEPFGDLPFEEAVAIFRELAEILAKNGADGFAIETMMDIQEARAALLGCKEAAPELPVMVTMTFEDSGRTLTGCHPVAALTTLQALGADAFGCNCSTGPAEMAKLLRSIAPYAEIPLAAKPNAGIPKFENGRTVFPMGAAEFGSFAEELVSSGARILGGCCGTTPEHIKAQADHLENVTLPASSEPLRGVISSVSEFRRITPDGAFTLVGERINPTGKKALQAELRSGCTDMVFEYALQQSSAGASVLDVNMGLSGIDEKEMMIKSLHRLVGSTSSILCIDSTDPATVEAALRLYPGRALLNSISAEKNRIEKTLPIAAKYGAMLVVLPLTDEGIPTTADERMKVVGNIISEAAKYGYRKEDICVDALVMAVSADQEAAKCALEVIKRCNAEGLNTICGLSNVSFGLPSRPLVNKTFLGMAMGCGLNMAIANPLFEEIIELINSRDVLTGADTGFEHFISKYAGVSVSPPPVSGEVLKAEEKLYRAVMVGNSPAVAKLCDEALAGGFPLQDLVDKVLISAITEVGEKYSRKEYFLPQLIRSAEAMQAAMAHLEKEMATGGNSGKKKTPVIIATVKGDIHDIGKNIVAVMLKNYDFEVIDLGKDVPAETIIAKAKEYNVKAVLLSALMTTTMGNMREVVELARQSGCADIKFIVGGAVVDDTFAKSIGAHYGAAPMDSVKLALEFTR
ncbi:MAG: 5-methyltetrahydrofolate--homocysteine methyltransferase [Lentisphaerae bacterium]|nr:5-methyltetrahydrofolate--homocysteine methyltransferase [Lentisphaerota bacterium]